MSCWIIIYYWQDVSIPFLFFVLLIFNIASVEINSKASCSQQISYKVVLYTHYRILKVVSLVVLPLYVLCHCATKLLYDYQGQLPKLAMEWPHYQRERKRLRSSWVAGIRKTVSARYPRIWTVDWQKSMKQRRKRIDQILQEAMNQYG